MKKSTTKTKAKLEDPETTDRARAMADMEGRIQPTYGDRIAALETAQGEALPANPEPAPENPISVDLSDEVALTRGHQIPNQPIEDEENIGEKLVAKGISGPKKSSPMTSK